MRLIGLEMLRKIWHVLLSGHQWELKAQTKCAPSINLANWQAEQTYPTISQEERSKLVSKFFYGWSEALLICKCGVFTKIEMVGDAKTN